MANKEQKKEQIGITAKKESDLSNWYQQVILKSDLADYSSVSGCIVFKPSSYLIWEKIKEKVDGDFKKLGIQNTYFPLFIPERLLNKEAEHFEGFTAEVAWVTHAGETKLEERLAIRPTSETIMYESYAQWIRSWRDLPLRLNQWNNVVRWEFKHPIPFLRTREFLWNEGHTVFATKEEAEKEANQILDIYKDVLENYIALPSILGRKTEKEKFAGAEYTLAFELILPNGRAIQGPDFHHDGQRFAKAFGIKFLDKNEKEQYAWQNTFAITTRMLGVMIMIHGDDKGLVLPPNLAPVQAVIIPILFKESKEEVLKKAGEIKNSLKNYSVVLDDREEYSAGWKFNEWEIKGVPVRIEVGPKDLDKGHAVIVRRDNSKKEFVKFKDISNKVNELFEDIHKSLFNKAKKLLDEKIEEPKTWNEFIKIIKNNKVVRAPFCNSAECEDWIKDKTGGAKCVTLPLDQPKKINGRCLQCGKEAKVIGLFAKSY